MWHWLVSGLASGATLVLYDGSPFRYLGPNSISVADDLAMPRLIQELSITHFGTSAKYLSMLEQNAVVPSSHSVSLSSLKAIYSTGSPLAPSTFSYIYSCLSSTINLGSITGGTDIISLFGAPCPLTPVYCGEIQVAGLGMSIHAFDYAGKDITQTGEAGDLVCTRPFVSQPVSFWSGRDSDRDDTSSKGVNEGEKKYRASYFDVFGTNTWHHGDFVRFNPATGGIYMLGRSDGTLKPSGVRFGSAEIYNLLLRNFAKETEDALCIGRRREGDSDETVVLFLKMRGECVCDALLVGRIKACVRTELSARHVPGIIDQTPEIPVTTNGKK